MSPICFGECRPTGSLVDVYVGRDRNDERVTLLPRFFEMQEVAIMDQIKHTVTEHDGFPGRFDLGNALRESLEWNDLVSHARRT